MRSGWVYILECCDGSYYTGSTTQIDTRISQHELGLLGGYTACRRPVKLRWSDEFPDIYQAIAAERQIKGWSRKKKEALIEGDFDLIRELAQSREIRERRKMKREKKPGHAERSGADSSAILLVEGATKSKRLTG